MANAYHATAQLAVAVLWIMRTFSSNQRHKTTPTEIGMTSSQQQLAAINFQEDIRISFMSHYSLELAIEEISEKFRSSLLFCFNICFVFTKILF